jgi:hypothetical protein
MTELIERTGNTEYIVQDNFGEESCCETGTQKIKMDLAGKY